MSRQTRTLCLLWLMMIGLPAAASSAAVSFRLEAESFPGIHTVMSRSMASNERSVYVRVTSEPLSFPFCLYRQLSANITVTYSNDGGKDDVRVRVDDAQDMTFQSVDQSNGGLNWNVFRSEVFRGITLNRGQNRVNISFETLDQYGIEIDSVDVSLDDDFMTDDVFRCKFLIGAEPPPVYGSSGVSPGYVQQRSYRTTCAEEDNVDLPVYHPTVQQYTVTATNPLYQSQHDYKAEDTSNCPNLDPVYWRFQDVSRVDDGGSDVLVLPTSPVGNLNKATMVGTVLSQSQAFNVMYTVSFNLKGVSTGFIDADIYSDLKAVFCQSVIPSPPPTVRISYLDRGGQEVILDTFDLEGNTTTKQWLVPEMTWSEKRRNKLTVKVTHREVSVCKLELIRGYTGPDRPVDLYSSGAVLLQGFISDFWWRRPFGEDLTVTVGDQTTANLSRVAVYVPVAWTGNRSYHQIFVLYQDGNVRLVPIPRPSPDVDKWTPFGTSVIIGKSSPFDLRPAASIRTMTFYPETLEMYLTYYDGSTTKLALTYSDSETRLKVTEMNFSSSTFGQPFAAFRSMFVRFGNTDADSVQSEAEGPKHVLGAWDRLDGTDFMVYRAVESYHLTQSPDIRLTIQG